jgi:uncharacterized repeat protein (TIGR01451 family)
MFRNVQRKLGVILLGCAAATTGLVLTRAMPAGADTVVPTYLSRAPQTSEECGNGFSILKFVDGDNFDLGLHTDKSSGDPSSTATFTITATTLSLSSVVVGGQPAIVQSVIIGNNGAGNAYQWNYGGGIVPTTVIPLVHTSSAATPLINPTTGNQYFFVCAAPYATLTLNKVVTGGTALPAAWTLNANANAGLTPFFGTSGVTKQVAIGTYSLSESGGPAGYSQIGWTCRGVATLSPSVTLTAGETVSCSVTNGLPGIKVVKTASAATVENGTLVTYTYAVTLALGTVVPLGSVTLGDNKCAAISAAVKTGGDVDALLETGETWTYTCTMALNVNTTNIATASGITSDNISVSDTDSVTVMVLHPAITLSKSTATPLVSTGTTVTFTIVVTNSGDAPLVGVTVSDPKAPGCNKVIGALAAGGTTTYTCTMVINGSTVNVATVTGSDALQTVVTATGSQLVEVSDPGLTITKTVDKPVVRVGETVSYSIVVRNPAMEASIFSVRVVDAAVPACNQLIGTLAAGALFSYECTALAGTDGVTNVAVATGESRNESKLTAEATATYKVIHPAILLVKNTTTPIVVSGTNATFSVTVTNTGDVALTAVTVTDALAPGCARVIPSLAVGASQTINCTVAVTASFTNTASVSAKPSVGPNVTSSDTEPVTVINPSINIGKTTATPSVTSGGTVTFSITVTNPGDTALSNVTVTDPTTPSCARSIGNLAAGALVTYTCTTDGLTASFINVASVTGKPVVGPDVSKSAEAGVTVVTTTTTTSTTTTTVLSVQRIAEIITTTTTLPALIFPAIPNVVAAPIATAAPTTVAPTAPPTTSAIFAIAGVTVLPTEPPVIKVLGETVTQPAFTGSRTDSQFFLALALAGLGSALLLASRRGSSVAGWRRKR